MNVNFSNDDMVQILPVFVTDEPQNLYSPNTERLFSELDAIFGVPKELNESERMTEAAIFSEMDALFNKFFDMMDGSEKVPGIGFNQAMEEKFAQLDSQLNELYGVKSYDDLSDVERQRVEEIHNELDATFNKFFGMTEEPNIDMFEFDFSDPMLDPAVTDGYSEGFLKQLAENSEQGAKNSLDNFSFDPNTVSAVNNLTTASETPVDVFGILHVGAGSQSVGGEFVLEEVDIEAFAFFVNDFTMF